MLDFIQRIITILIASTTGIFLITYYPLTFFILGSSLIYGELLYGLYKGDKLNHFDILILALAIIFYYLNQPVLLIILLSHEPGKVFLYYVVGRCWTYPTIYLSYNYVQSDPVSFIVISTIIWFSDGGAYIFGKTLGKHKLAPTISPNKTIEGAIGGVLTSTLVAYLISFYYFKIPTYDLIILGSLYGVFGTIGDLAESKFKRWVGVKDSGFLFGNSGGILDKTDSLFFAIPIGHLYLTYKGINFIN